LDKENKKENLHEDKMQSTSERTGKDLNIGTIEQTNILPVDINQKYSTPNILISDSLSFPVTANESTVTFVQKDSPSIRVAVPEDALSISDNVNLAYKQYEDFFCGRK